jgi:hypothetical protein
VAQETMIDKTMNIAGKYMPDIFPNQRLMHSLAKQTTNAELKDALLTFQYPFRVSDLTNSSYSENIKQTILNVVGQQ